MTEFKNRLKDKIVLITGASSGIGEATARLFAEQGCSLALGARREEKLAEIAKSISGIEVLTHALDVTDSKSVEAFMQSVLKRFGKIDILVNNAGLALQLDTIETGKESDWEQVMETNVLGLLRVTKRALQMLIPASHPAHIINLGSVASFLTYEGGGTYTASKHAVKAITGTLRLELLGRPVRVTSIDPGMVETEFSQVRFQGDQKKAQKVYEGMTPLTATDVAECIVFAANRPAHVNVDQIIVNPLDQALLKVNRKT